MKPIPELLQEPFEGQAALIRRGRAFAHLTDGGSESSFDDQVAMREVSGKWREIRRRRAKRIRPQERRDATAGIAAQAYLARGGDPAVYPDQTVMRRVLPWFLLHREPGHRCEVCVTPGPVSPISFCRKSRALSHLLDGRDRASFADQEALASVLPVCERSLPSTPLFEERV